MRPAEQPAEIAGIEHPDPPGDLGDRKIGLGQQAAGFGHAAFDDPLLHGASGAAAHHGGQVSRRHADFARHVAQRQRLGVTLGRSPRTRRPAAVPRCAAGRRPRRGPDARARSAAASGAPGPPADSPPAARSVRFRSTRIALSHTGRRAAGTSSRSTPPECPCRNGKSSGCARHAGHGDRASSPSAAGSKNTATPASRFSSCRVEHLARRRHVHQTRGGHVPQRGEVVDVATQLGECRRGRAGAPTPGVCPDRSGTGRWAHRRGG